MLIVGIGGTMRPDSYSERALRLALGEAADLGAETICLAGPAIALPFYEPCEGERPVEATKLIEALRAADGVILASPGYHGSISGLLKNALDYVEDMSRDERPYLDGLPVGCVGLGFGIQGAVAAVQALRSVAHALRGWPTPYGCTVALRPHLFEQGGCADELVENQLRMVGRQVVQFASAARHANPVEPKVRLRLAS